MFAFLLTQKREDGFISWSKENFFLEEQPQEIMNSDSIRIEDSLYFARSQIQSYYRKPYKIKWGKLAPFFLICNHYFSNCSFPHVLFRQSVYCIVKIGFVTDVGKGGNLYLRYDCKYL